MSSSIQLPSVSAKITGDASSLVSELRRGKTATSVTTAEMSHELEHFSKTMTRNFGLAHIGKDFLRGLGIGSGFHLAETASEKIVEHWKKSAEIAKEIEAISERTTAAVLKGITARQSPEMQVSKAAEEMEKLQKELAELQKPKFESNTVGVGMGMTATVTTNRVRDQTDEEKKAAAELTEKIVEQGAAIDEARHKISERADALKAERQELQLNLNVERGLVTAQQAASFKLDDLIDKTEELKKKKAGANAIDVAENAVLAQRSVVEKLRNKAVGDELDSFFGDMDKHEAKIHASGKRAAQRRERSVDDFTARGGFLGGNFTDDLPKRQLSVLEQMRDLLKRMTPTLRGDGSFTLA